MTLKSTSLLRLLIHTHPNALMKSGTFIQNQPHIPKWLSPWKHINSYRHHKKNNKNQWNNENLGLTTIICLTYTFFVDLTTFMIVHIINNKTGMVVSPKCFKIAVCWDLTGTEITSMFLSDLFARTNQTQHHLPYHAQLT